MKNNKKAKPAAAKAGRERAASSPNRIRRDSAYQNAGSLALMVMFILTTVTVLNRYEDIVAVRFWCLFGWMAALLIILGLIFWTYKEGRNKTPFELERSFAITTVGDWAMIAYLLIATLSAFLSDYQDAVYVGTVGRNDGLLTQYLYGVIYFTASRLYRYAKWHTWLLAILTGLFTVTGILQFFGLNPFGLYYPGYNYFYTQFITFFGNINYTSTAASLMALLFAMLFIRSDEKDSWVYLLTAFLAFALQTISSSDSGWVCIGAGFLFTVPFVFISRGRIMRFGLAVAAMAAGGLIVNLLFKGVIVPTVRFADRRPIDLLPDVLFIALIAGGIVLFAAALLLGKRINLKRSTAMALSVGLVVLVIAGGVGFIEVYGGREGQTGTIYQARELLHGRMEDSFMTNRGYAWRTGFGLIGENPILGSGPDTFGLLHKAVYGENAAKEVLGINLDKAHNEYIQYAVCEGILGLLAYLVLIGGTLYTFIKRRRYEDGAPVIAFAAAAAVTGYIAQAIFNNSMVHVATFFFAFLGIMASREGVEDAGK